LRPRISRKEAQFLTELLEVAISDLELKQKYHKELDLEVFRLKRQLMKGAGYEIIMAGYPEKKRELEKWQVNLRFIVYYNLDIAKKLLEKYKAIAEGNSHKGTYKHFNTRLYHSIFREDEGKFKQVLNMQLEPIEDLGKRQTIAEQKATT